MVSLPRERLFPDGSLRLSNCRARARTWRLFVPRPGTALPGWPLFRQLLRVHPKRCPPHSAVTGRSPHGLLGPGFRPSPVWEAGFPRRKPQESSSEKFSRRPPRPGEDGFPAVDTPTAAPGAAGGRRARPSRVQTCAG